MEKFNEIFAVAYYGGEYDDYFNKTVFVTKNEQTAIDYVNKFNSILQKWKDYYKQFEEDGWIKKEFEDGYFRRWLQIRNVSKCYYTKIQIR